MDTSKLTTDQLFNTLPSMVNVNGNFYHFRLIKGNKRIIVEYKTNPSEGERNLRSTFRTGKTLKEALKSMLDWLIEFGYYNRKSDNILVDMIHNNLNQEKEDTSVDCIVCGNPFQPERPKDNLCDWCAENTI